MLILEWKTAKFNPVDRFSSLFGTELSCQTIHPKQTSNAHRKVLMILTRKARLYMCLFLIPTGASATASEQLCGISLVEPSTNNIYRFTCPLS